MDANLVRNGEELASDECDMLCEGTTTDERCGGWYKMTAYVINTQVTEGYIGCYADTPYWAIDAEEDPFKGNMTNEVSGPLPRVCGMALPFRGLCVVTI